MLPALSNKSNVIRLTQSGTALLWTWLRISRNTTRFQSGRNICGAYCIGEYWNLIKLSGVGSHCVMWGWENGWISQRLCWEYLTHWPLQDVVVIFTLVILKVMSGINIWTISFSAMPKGLTALINIGSGNGFVPSGRKPSPEAILTKLDDAIWRHETTMC